MVSFNCYLTQSIVTWETSQKGLFSLCWSVVLYVEDYLQSIALIDKERFDNCRWHHLGIEIWTIKE